ncbi:hypothetical protein BGZ60DRAFT_286556 [Tricladium varicosporioides]|nr:hypothetical protein BGZ60DRAFT_286556 [Hymenoscyphus varicosporioides]
MSTTNDDLNQGNVTLRTRADWAEWYLQLRYNSMMQKVWHLVDPEAPDAPDLDEPLALPPTIADLIEERSRELQGEGNSTGVATRSSSSTRTAASMSPIPRVGYSDVKEQFQDYQRSYMIAQAAADRLNIKYQKIWVWVRSSVDQGLLSTVMYTQRTEEKSSLQALVRNLQKIAGSTEASTKTSIREQYRNCLKQAEHGNVNPTRWQADWYKLYQRARAYGLEEIKGTLAIRDFLTAVSYKIAPDWARRELTKVIGNDELGEEGKMLEQYATWFSALIQENSARHSSRQPGIFATIGERSDTGASPARNDDSGNPSCPCRAQEERKHR